MLWFYSTLDFYSGYEFRDENLFKADLSLQTNTYRYVGALFRQCAAS